MFYSAINKVYFQKHVSTYHYKNDIFQRKSKADYKLPLLQNVSYIYRLFVSTDNILRIFYGQADRKG